MATGVDAGHDENEDTYGVLQFDYTDAGSGGGRYIGSFNAGDHLAYSPVNLVNITGVRTHARGDGTLSLRFGAVDAPAFATIVVDSGAWSIVNTTFASVPTGTGAIVVSYPAKAPRAAREALRGWAPKQTATVVVPDGGADAPPLRARIATAELTCDGIDLDQLSGFAAKRGSGTRAAPHGDEG